MLHFNEEMKRFLRGKTLIKNFPNIKVELVTTIPALEVHPE
jgi:glutaredoxin-related protein